MSAAQAAGDFEQRDEHAVDDEPRSVVAAHRLLAGALRPARGDDRRELQGLVRRFEHQLQPCRDDLLRIVVRGRHGCEEHAGKKSNDRLHLLVPFRRERVSIGTKRTTIWSKAIMTTMASPLVGKATAKIAVITHRPW